MDRIDAAVTRASGAAAPLPEASFDAIVVPPAPPLVAPLALRVEPLAPAPVDFNDRLPPLLELPVLPALPALSAPVELPTPPVELPVLVEPPELLAPPEGLFDPLAELELCAPPEGPPGLFAAPDEPLLAAGAFPPMRPPATCVPPPPPPPLSGGRTAFGAAFAGGEGAL